MNSDVPLHEGAFRLVLKHRTMLKAYVHAIVRDPLLAEDTFSDVTLEVARSWSRFDASKAFEPGARGVARRVALANLRKANRPLVTLHGELLESIGAGIDQLGTEADHEEYKRALLACVRKLSMANQALVRLRYFDGLSYEAIGQHVNRTPGALYVAFNRIHQALSRCVEKQMRSAFARVCQLVFASRCCGI